MDNQQPKFKKNAQKFYLKPDTIYGNWKTIKQIEIKSKKCIETRWECIHLPTGEIKLQTAAYLAPFLTNEEKLNRLKDLVEKDEHQIGIRNYLYRTYKIGAESRKHGFYLIYEDFIKLIKKDCFYCGEPPTPTSKKMLKARGNTNEPPFYYNGIDRINSDKDYTIDNVVPCCKTCNYMKHTLSQEQFYDKIIKIAKNLKLGSTTISEESTSEAYADGNREDP